jgi:hypothetical protein
MFPTFETYKMLMCARGIVTNVSYLAAVTVEHGKAIAKMLA